MTDYQYRTRIARWERFEEVARLFVYSVIAVFAAAGLAALHG